MSRLSIVLPSTVKTTRRVTGQWWRNAAFRRQGSDRTNLDSTNGRRALPPKGSVPAAAIPAIIDALPRRSESIITLRIVFLYRAVRRLILCAFRLGSKGLALKILNA